MPCHSSESFMFNTLHEGAIPVRIGVAALPPTRAISYHEDRRNNRFFYMAVFMAGLVFVMVVPPPQEKNLSPWQGLLITEID